jgi:chorismate-pyruvate lyase
VAPIAAPDFHALYRLFPTEVDKPFAEIVPADDVPQPYHRLLVHTHHMTVTVEQFYGQPVDVKVLECWLADDEYARKILLSTKHTSNVVQFGLVRIDLSVCPKPVRDAILEGKTPLGRVLIENDMLRRIEPTAFLRVHLGDVMADWFGCQPGAETYGRLCVIYTGDHPVIAVLEILTPVESSKSELG